MGSRSRPRANPANTSTSNKKLTPDQEQALIKEYGIRFLDSVLPSQWPASYAPMFSKVREIEDIRYERYRSSLEASPHRIQRVRTLNRVHRLVRDVSDCRKASLHEEEWRRSTEPNLLQHFNDDIICGLCGNRTWVAEFKFDPPLPWSARTRNSGDSTLMPVCSCNPNEVVRVENSNESSRPFLTRLSLPIPDASSPAQIGVRKPDAVVGLRKVPQLEDLLKRRPGMMCSLESEDQMVFPFLVLEAKSEVGGTGFQSIETQTAFPIRTLVNIQESLNQHATSKTEPLVWFLAYSGPMCNVYACIRDGGLTKVIQLWHGMISNYDHALQLNLIVDLIYDWAIEVYQKDIFACLSGGGPTTAPVQECVNTARLVIPDASIDLSIGEESQWTQDMDVLSVPTASSDTEMLGPDTDGDNTPSSPPQVTIPEEEPTEDWSSCAVIRNAHEVFFTFHHMILPETETELTAILSSISPRDSIAKAAYALLQLFHIEDPMVVDGRLLTQIEGLWTEEVHELESSHDGGPVLAHLCFRSYFRTSDWQLIRNLSCITASVSAINILGSIAYDGYDALLDPSGLPISSLTADVVLPLRRLSGQESAAAATQSLSLTLQKEEPTSPEHKWLKTLGNGEYMTDMWKGLDTHTPSVLLFNIMVYSSLRRTVREERFSSPGAWDSVPYAKLGWATRTDGALIVKRPSTWLAQCPKYCLIVFDGSATDDLPRMSRRILQVTVHGGFYQESGRGVSEDDRQAMERWAAFLAGGSPGSTSGPWRNLR